jgi:ribosomal protein S18 acetylase RimI-like enzyme
MKQVETLKPDVLKLLRFTVLKYMLDTLCENPKLARIFVDDEDNPKTCIIAFHHLLFFGGNLTKDCLQFLLNEILAADVRKNQSIFYMLYPDEVWKNALTELFSHKCNQYERSLYIWKAGCMDKLSCCDNIVEITSELMDSDVNNLNMITDEVVSTGTYDNMEDYLTRGIGYTPVINNKVCGFCTSEYQSRNSVAIGIEVLEEYQRQGYGKTMTKAFLNKAAQRGLTVYWECWKNNIASANTALSCGFEKVGDYPILFIKL